MAGCPGNHAAVSTNGHYRADVANVEAVEVRESALTPVEALWTAMRKTHPGTTPEDCWAILESLPKGWGLVDTQAVGVAGATLLLRLGDVE